MPGNVQSVSKRTETEHELITICITEEQPYHCTHQGERNRKGTKIREGIVAFEGRAHEDLLLTLT